MMYGDCDIPEFFQEKKHTARKEHTCCECGYKILPNEVYYVCSGKWDGEFQTYKQHARCYHFVRHINLDVVEECVIPFTGLDEYIAEDEDELGKHFQKLWETIKDGFEFKPHPRWYSGGGKIGAFNKLKKGLRGGLRGETIVMNPKDKDR